MEHQKERHTITAESPKVDLELQKLWDEAQNEFQKNTNRKLVSIPPRKIEDVLAQLKGKFQPENGVQPGTKHKIKDAIEIFLNQLLDALEAEKAYLRFYFPESNMQANLLTSTKAFLASYYSQSKDFVKAQDLFRDDVFTAISILEDEDPDNDPIGYKSLIRCFIHTGDDRNALNAWSLLYPNDTLARSDDDEGESIRSGPLDAKCKGGCGKTWTYADDFYICKSCYQTIFCGDCLDELKGNRSKTWACHPEHSWLHVPPWNDENVAGKGMIRVIDESDSSKEVKISDWIKDLKRIWEIE